MSTPSPEVRALWVTRWDYRTAADVRAIIERAAASGFNTLFFQVRGQADAYYASPREPWAARLTGTLGQYPGWDPLGLAVSLAHEIGLSLQAWINVYPVWLGTEPPPHSQPEHPYHVFTARYGDRWRQWDINGPMPLSRHYLWASPAHWGVLEHILAVSRDIVEGYAVDGLHLDYVRYAGRQYSRDPESLARFQDEQTLTPELTWAEWRCRQVSYLVQCLREEVLKRRPGLTLTAAVWPVARDRWRWGCSEGYTDYGQDAPTWLQAGWVDAALPMLYTGFIKNDEARFVTLVQDWLAQGDKGSVYPGITADYDDFSALARRIELTRQAGAKGHAIFSAGLLTRRGYWEALRQGPYA